MSESEDDEDFAFFGTPLEPFDEDVVARKRPVALEDQVVTDSHGRRRFHGAFTGGFSAGFFNSVGSLEGWKPSSFRSSRNERSKVDQQLPSHFMDSEDVEEFGIAPQVLKTKPEYSSRQSGKKRDRRVLDSGPIPGEPVLTSLLKPTRHSVGIVLLIKMGWKPGDDIGEKLMRKCMRRRRWVGGKTKVYGCARGPDDDRLAGVGDDCSSDDDEMYRELGRKAPSFSSKEDTMGLGYRGLDRSALTLPTSKSSHHITLRDQFNKTITISGQAFGVGAFEEEDDDVYSTDDRSQYDLSLEPLNPQSKKPVSSQPAITSTANAAHVLLGFVKASVKEVGRRYEGPRVPADFTGRHVEKVSRFDTTTTTTAAAASHRHQTAGRNLDAELRNVMLDPAPPVRIKEEVAEEEGEGGEMQQPQLPSQGLNKWKPFDSDPAKQERYEKYLHFIRIGAQDAVGTVLLNTMTDVERECEVREFEGAARLYSGSLMSDRFTHASLPDSGAQVKLESDQPAECQRSRISSDWTPHPLVCKRFNIRPPHTTGTSLQSVAESSRKPKCSVFDFLNASKTANLADLVESSAGGDATSGFDAATRCELVSGTGAADSSDSSMNHLPPETASIAGQVDSLDTPTPLLPRADDETFDEPADKMDLFKAIFLDSEDEEGKECEGSREEGSDAAKPSDSSRSDSAFQTANILRNTSPPRGIFANLNLDELSNKRAASDRDAVKLTTPPPAIFQNERSSSKPDAIELVKEEAEDSSRVLENSYGPSLPTVPVEKPKSYINLELDITDDRWVEKSSTEKSGRSTEKSSRESRDKHRHKHHKKKHKKEKKREKHKKKRKRKSSDSSD